jgi:pyruvate-ferredoxin/flavodoxin oxidoreductase
MAKGMNNQRMAVESGHWPLYRYNPLLAKDGKNPFKLDSKPPKISFEDYAYMETRYKMLTKSNPEAAKDLMALAEGDAKRRVAKYEAMAQEAGKD